jgi:molybdate transport system substrate-binding protein
MKTLSSALLGFSILCFTSLAADQTHAPLRILASNGIKAVVEDMKASVEKTTSRPLAIIFDSTTGLRKHIDAGEAFDVALFTSEGAEPLLKNGTLDPSTSAILARAGVGVGYRTGTPKPDVHTAEGMKKALLAAKSITYAGDGASRAYVDKMIEKLGLTATLKPRTVLAQGSGPATADVAAGKSDLVLTLISEILPVPGLSLAGGIPDEFQSYISFTAAASAKTPNLEAAKKLIAAFKSPSVAMIYKARGMEPR